MAETRTSNSLSRKPRRLLRRFVLTACVIASLAMLRVFAEPEPANQREAVVDATLRLAKEAAEHELSRLADSDQRATAFGKLAMLYHAQNRLDDAVAYYRDAVREHPAHRWHYLLAVALADRGDIDAAIAEYQRAIASDGNPLASYRLGLALLVKGDDESAKRVLLQARTALPDSAAVLTALGDATMAGGDWEQAAALLERAAAMEPNAGRIAYRLAMTYRQLGDLDEAAHWLSRRNPVAPAIEDPLLLAVATNSLSAKFFLDAGDRAWERGERDEALAAYRNATAVEPDNVRAGLALAQALGANDDVAAALAEVRRVLLVDATSARAWYLQAHLLRNAEPSDDALTAVQRSLQLADDRAARTLLAALRMRARQFDAAAGEYERLAAQYPDAAYYRYWLGIAQLGAGQCQDARRALGVAARLQTNWGQAHIALARADALCGDARANDDARQRALKLLAAKDDADTHLTLAFAELAAGNRQAARELVEAHRSHADAALLLDALADGGLPRRPFANASEWWLPPELR